MYYHPAPKIIIIIKTLRAKKNSYWEYHCLRKDEPEAVFSVLILSVPFNFAHIKVLN